MRRIAARLGRAPSTISRELSLNRRRYRPYEADQAQRWCEARRPRPKPSKLATHPELWNYVRASLKHSWSPQQISQRLHTDYPDREDMRVSPETIYRTLYVQARGTLRVEVAAALRNGRILRRPHTPFGGARAYIPGLVSISERPAEAADRAVPGHWEGDLIVGRSSHSQIGTLVERTTRYVLLVHLPNRKDATTVAEALAAKMSHLPELLKRSLTWDRGTEMTNHLDFTATTDIPVYFCDPHSPWQRGSNENTNGLLRQYFPKSTDLSVHTEAHLDWVATELNGRPRKTLGWQTPAEALSKLLSDHNNIMGVATTP